MQKARNASENRWRRIWSASLDGSSVSPWLTALIGVVLLGAVGTWTWSSGDYGWTVGCVLGVVLTIVVVVRRLARDRHGSLDT